MTDNTWTPGKDLAYLLLAVLCSSVGLIGVGLVLISIAAITQGQFFWAAFLIGAGLAAAGSYGTYHAFSKKPGVLTDRARVRS